jgi:hypothetical protein
VENKVLKIRFLKDPKISHLGRLGKGHFLTEFDPKEVELGLAAEMEHTEDISIAAVIVKDHLTEDPKYYTKLKAAGLEQEEI